MACPSMLASRPVSMLNQNLDDLGIPIRINLISSRSRSKAPVLYEAFQRTFRLAAPAKAACPRRPRSEVSRLAELAGCMLAAAEQRLEFDALVLAEFDPI